MAKKSNKKLLIVVGVIVLALVIAGVVFFQMRSVADLSREELRTLDQKAEGYHNSAAILTPRQAKDLIDKNDNVVVLDVRLAADYALGHVPNAVQCYRPDYSGTVDGIAGFCLTKEEVEEMLRSKGVKEDSFIILYDNRGNLDSARVYWTLRYYGHDKNKLALIDGGYDMWRASGLDTSLRTPSVTRSNYTFIGQPNTQYYATYQDVLSAIEDPNVIILDTRAIGEYTGENPLNAPRDGRIPSAVHMNWVDNKNDNESFKAYDELKAMYEAIGVTPDKTIITYCQSGVRSTNTFFVLKELLGYPNVKNYDGSWIEWATRDHLPIEIGTN